MSALRVLIVDDNEMNVRLAEVVLGAAGISVASAADGCTALTRIAAELPDLVLMDIQMPGIDGLMLTQRLRANPRTRAIRIIAFTAYAMRGDEDKLIAAGCDGYISKPIDVATFADTVRAFATAA